MSAPARIRVVIADDHPMYRYGLRAVLERHPEVELCGEAPGGRALVELAVRLRPQVIITDLHMPDLDGISAIRRILDEVPGDPPAVLALTMLDDDEAVYGAMRAGARGYLLKGADHAELVATIQALARGESVFGPSVARRITGFFLESAAKYATGAFPELTGRERDVLDLLAAGHRNSAIAAELGLAEKTVRNHLSAILTKLQVPDRSAAIIRAREAGLGRG